MHRFRYLDGLRGVASLAFLVPTAITFLGGLLTLHRVVTEPDADAYNFYRYSLHALAGTIPYRDFPFEFPPLALLPMLAPDVLTWGHAHGYAAYCIGFLIFNALIAGALGVTLVRISYTREVQATDEMAVIKWYSVLILSTAIVTPWRFDLLPTLLTALGLSAALRNRAAWAGVLLGLGTAVKLYPLLLVPVFAVMIARGDGSARDKDYPAHRHDAVRMALAFAATVAAIFGASAAIAGPVQSLSFLAYQGQRGIQIESVAAGVYFLAHALHLCGMGFIWNYGAFHMTASGTPIVIKLLTVLLASLYGAVVLRMARGGAGAYAAVDALRGSLLALLIFIATSKVFSPQYIVWLVPFATLEMSKEGVGRPVVYAVLGLFVLTALELSTYGGLLTFDPLSIAVLNLRNGVLIWLIALLFAGGQRLRRRRGP